METTALCSSNSFYNMQKLKVGDVVDYNQKDWLSQLNQKPK